MEQNQNAVAINQHANEKSLIVAAGCFAALLLSALIFSNQSLQLILILVSVLSIAYIFSFLPSVFLLSTVAFSLPLSVLVEDSLSGFSVIFPSEILGGIFACAITFRFFLHQALDRKFIFHPVTFLLLCYLFFNVVALIFSASILISAKAVFVKCVYVAAFYFIAYDVVTKNPKHAFVVFISYIMSLSIVIGFALVKHSAFDFDKSRILLAVLPFFKDHTIYSACIAFALPLTIGSCVFFFRKNIFMSTILFALIILLIAGIFFSYSRAAWLSILLAVPFYLFQKFEVKLYWAAILISSSVLFLWFNSDEIVFNFEQNKSNSNATFADLETQAKSITSISADESNAERLNRWKCALRMFNEKPLTGFGPGTYQFEYFPFQRYYDLTRISVFSPYNITQQGRGGTAHSEYLLVLSECGIFAFVFFILLCAGTVITGRKIYLKEKDKTKKVLALCVTCGLFTYLFHSMFNNFLDTDKAAFLFYSSIGVIVALDLKRGDDAQSSRDK